MAQSIPSASAKYMALISSSEGEIAIDIQDLRARVVHMAPTLNYAVACAGYHEAKRLLVTELRQGIAGVQSRCERLSRLASRDIAGGEWGLRRTVQTNEMIRRELERLFEDRTRFAEVLERLPRVNNVRKTQFDEDVHNSVIEMVKARWEYLRTGRLQESPIT